MPASRNDRDNGIRAPSFDTVLSDPLLARCIGHESPVDVGSALIPPVNDAETAIAIHQLQKAADYRATIRLWLEAVRIGGHLIISVPHAFLHDRLLALPARWDKGQRRLYTPASLLGEIEEALAPNSYRIRYVGDVDAGYDYALGIDQPPTGRADIVVAVQKMAPPAWVPALVVVESNPPMRGDHPDYSFEPDRTRIEVSTRSNPKRILLLKLDHLGDLVMGIGALEHVRKIWPSAEITVVVGSWNADMVRGLGMADRVISFDAFPRNSSEEIVDVPGKAGLFRAVVSGSYDLAIDLRTDHDTRFLLQHVDAAIRAGIGTHAQFPFLDVFLPIDQSRGEPETAREIMFTHHHFQSSEPTKRFAHRLVSQADLSPRAGAIIWGPYLRLRAGNYFFEPYIEIDRATSGALMLDVALDMKPVSNRVIDELPIPRLVFRVDRAGAEFEFRIWHVDKFPALNFSFYGGRLCREGGSSVLHQSEYGLLLLDLVKYRLDKTGILDRYMME